MAHIHTEHNQHDFTASAFIVHRSKNALLLHRHKKLGILIQPGGHVELTEHPWATMAHELEEETGYELSQLEALQAREELSQLEALQAREAIPGLVEEVHPTPLALRTHNFPSETVSHLHTDMAFGFVTDHEPVGVPGEDESQELYWLTADEIKAIPEGQIPPDASTLAIYLLERYSSFFSINAASFAH